MIKSGLRNFSRKITEVTLFLVVSFAVTQFHFVASLVTFTLITDFTVKSLSPFLMSILFGCTLKLCKYPISHQIFKVY